MNITLITNFGEPRPDYATIYLDMMIRATEKFAENPENKREYYKRAFFTGVKYAIYSMDYFRQTEESASSRFNFLCLTSAFLSLLTPAELIQLFPVEKKYNGERYGWKDYFYTMNVLRAHGMDTPIGDATMEILFDYVNPTIRKFVLANMRAMDDLRRIQGQTSICQEYLLERGYAH